MTIDEALRHCEEVAEQNEFETRIYDELNRQGDEECRNNHCQCAADHRQLAEWLRELKELREENKVLISECDRLIKEKGELLSKVSGAVEAADVQPVKHGKWIHINDDGFIFCSECEHEAYWDTDYGQQLFDFCPYCGAKMLKE